jgi:hypothetical protein
LLALVSAAEQYDASSTDHRVVDSIARAPVDTELKKATAQRPAIAKKASRKAVEPLDDSGRGVIIGQMIEPVSNQVFACAGGVMANFNHGSVTYKLHQPSAECNPLTTTHSHPYN